MNTDNTQVAELLPVEATKSNDAQFAFDTGALALGAAAALNVSEASYASAPIVENEVAKQKGLKPGIALAVLPRKSTHRRERSQYYEGEVHSS